MQILSSDRCGHCNLPSQQCDSRTAVTVKIPDENDAFLGFGSVKSNHKPFLNLSESGNLKEAAFNLFNFLRKLDKLKKKQISIYPIPNKGIGKVINERLNRANSK